MRAESELDLRATEPVATTSTTLTYRGKRGTLTIRERLGWVDASNENAPGFDFRPGVTFGTWKVVRGTGGYAGITGSGRTAHAGMVRRWLARQQGYLTTP